MDLLKIKLEEVDNKIREKILKTVWSCNGSIRLYGDIYYENNVGYYVNFYDGIVYRIRKTDIEDNNRCKECLNAIYGMNGQTRFVSVSDEVRNIFFQVDKILNPHSSENSEIICLEGVEYYINRKNNIVMKIEGVPNGK